MFEELKGTLPAADRDYWGMLDLQVPQGLPRLLIRLRAASEDRLTVPKALVLELETGGPCRLMRIVMWEKGVLRVGGWLECGCKGTSNG